MPATINFPALLRSQLPASTAASVAAPPATPSQSMMDHKHSAASASASTTTLNTTASPFIAQQLLRLCLHVDWADESGRRALSALMCMSHFLFCVWCVGDAAFLICSVFVLFVCNQSICCRVWTQRKSLCRTSPKYCAKSTTLMKTATSSALSLSSLSLFLSITFTALTVCLCDGVSSAMFAVMSTLRPGSAATTKQAAEKQKETEEEEDEEEADPARMALTRKHATLTHALDTWASEHAEAVQSGLLDVAAALKEVGYLPSLSFFWFVYVCSS